MFHKGTPSTKCTGKEGDNKVLAMMTHLSKADFHWSNDSKTQNGVQTQCISIYVCEGVLRVRGKEMVAVEWARLKGWCNEVIILLLSAVRKLFLTLIDVSGRIIWHFRTVAWTQLEMSDCQIYPPPKPSLSTAGALSLMPLSEHVC